ncbi:MAG TPA: malto-oligosyltrehalose trehalohydrolase [Chitinophagaceae bacterium]
MKAGPQILANGKTRFTVWSPLSTEMVLHVVHPFDRKLPMNKNQFGYFQVDAEVGAGCLYFYCPENEKDLPDPASQFQPQDVHGPSEVVDHLAYQWQDDDWKGIPFNEIILYELHIGTFTERGTFESAIEKLDHLASTGINTIEIMPVSQFPGNRNWGYDGAYPYAVQNSYGGPEGLKKLVDACHQKGIAVCLDVVYNHLGPEGNYFERFGPYFTDHYRSPWGRAINFDGQWSDGVRDFFSDNAVYWFEYFHIDGLRFDAIHAIYDMGAIHFWELMHKKTEQLEQRMGRKFYTIAESDLNDPKVIKGAELGGYGFTAQWLDDFHHVVYTLVDREEGKKLYADFGDMNQLAKAYKEGFVHSGDYVKFRKRKYGASSAGVSGNKFISFIENHDQSGNRATGDRLTSLISFEKIKLCAAANLLSPYIPMLFMGEEYGEQAPFFYFISHSDKELVKAVQEGRKKEFEHFGWSAEPPDPFEEKTFHESKLQWQTIGEKKHAIIHAWYKQLIQFRKSQAAFKNFDKNNVWVNLVGETIEIGRRSENEKEKMVCLFNFSDSITSCISIPAAHSSWNKLVDSNDKNWVIDNQKWLPLPATVQPERKIEIPPLTAVVYGNVE